MGGPLILEVIDHRGRVRHLHRLTGDRLTIGRGYDNDVILDDPYVEGRHLVLGADPETGALEFRDPGSTNGTWTGDRRRVAGVVEPGLTLQVGRTTLRFVTPDSAVPPALPDRRRTSRLGLILGSPLRALILAVAGCLAVALTVGMDDPEPMTADSFLALAAWTALAGAAWAGAWALASRLVVHHFRFTAHLAWIALIAVAGLAVDGVIAWTGFLLPDLVAVPIARGALELGLVALLLAGHLGLAADWERWRRWRVAAATALVLGLGAVALRWNDEAVAPDSAVGFASLLRPLAARFIPAETPDHFFRRTDGLVRQLDRLAGDGPR